MDHRLSALLTANLVALPQGAWRQLRLPETLDCEFGSLSTSGLAFGAHVSPTDLRWVAPGKLTPSGRFSWPVAVDLVLSPWSTNRVELTLQPTGNLRWMKARYLRAANALVGELAREFELQGLLIEPAIVERSPAN
jgi:hypothetical protein